MTTQPENANPQGFEEDPGVNQPAAADVEAGAAQAAPAGADESESDDQKLAELEQSLAPLSVEELTEKVGQLGDELARAKADLYNLNQEYSGYVRRSKAEAPALRQTGQAEVLEALISVLDDIEGARQHGDLEQDSPFKAIAQKLEETLSSRFQMERYGKVGDVFDPNMHDALMAQEGGEADEPTIGQVLQPGYRFGERILRPTKVMVINPA